MTRSCDKAQDRCQPGLCDPVQNHPSIINGVWVRRSANNLSHSLSVHIPQETHEEGWVVVVWSRSKYSVHPFHNTINIILDFKHWPLGVEIRFQTYFIVT